MLIVKLLLPAILLMCTYDNCSAARIVFSYEGVSSGWLENNNINDKPFVITGIGNTANRIPLSTYGYAIVHDFTMISIADLGTFTVSTPTRTFLSPTSELVGLARSSTGGTSGTNLIHAPVDATFATWDLLSSVGPVSGSGEFLQWGGINPPVITAGGTLYFDTDNDVPITFAAIVTADGDFDSDGDVDGHDFLAWQRYPGLGDLADWEADYGLFPAVNSANIPEPTSATLALTFALLAGYHVHTQQRVGMATGKRIESLVA